MKKYILIIIALLFVLSGFYIYKIFNYTYITAKFKELRPMEEKIPVYYKGIVVGRAKEKKHTDDFQHTLIKLVLYPKNLLLPQNTTVLLKKEKKNDKERDFLELIYPKNPSKIMLSDGSTIEGIATVDIETFIKNQHPDDLEAIKENLMQSAESLNYALSGFSQMFEIINGILNENKPNIFNTTKNVSGMTQKVNNSIEQQKLNDTIANVELSTKQAALLVENSQNTLQNADLSLNEVQGIAQNINAITCGVRKTLRKKFGGLRLIFGQVIDECNDY